MLGLGRLTKTVSDATIGTAIVRAQVAWAEYLADPDRTRSHGVVRKHGRAVRIEIEQA